MKNYDVHIFGVVGHNFGDEAIAVGASQEIRQIVPTSTVAVTSSARRDLQDRYGIKELKNHRRSVRGVVELINSVRKAGVILIGGGTLIQDKLGLSLLRGNLAYSLQIALLAKFFGKPVGTLAIGVDELETQRGRVFARWFLQLMGFVLVRDELSLQLAKRYSSRNGREGATASQWLVGADPAFLIEDESAALPGRIKFTSYLVLSLVHEDIDWVPFLDQLQLSVSLLIQDGVIDGVVLLAMDDRPTEELSVFQAWRLKFPHLLSVTQVHVPTDVYDAAKVIREAKLMVAARLHAMILGLGSVPFLALSRTTKTESFLAYTHATGIDARASLDYSRLAAILRGILEDADQLSRQKSIVEDLKSRARAGIQQLFEGLVKPTTGQNGGEKTP